MLGSAWQERLVARACVAGVACEGRRDSIRIEPGRAVRARHPLIQSRFGLAPTVGSLLHLQPYVY